MGGLLVRIASPQLGLDPKTTLGGERYDVEILLRLAHSGHKVFVLLPKQRAYPYHENLHVEQLPIRRIVPPYIFNVFVLFYLFRVYRKNLLDIIRVHNPYFVGIAALFFKMMYPKVKVVATYYHLEHSMLQRMLDKLIACQFDAIVVPSQATKQDLVRQYGIDSSRITVFYAGIDKTLRPKRKSPVLVKRFGLKDKQVLLFLSSLIPRKNPWFALKVLSKIHSQDVVLLMAGSGPLYWLLRAHALLLGVQDRVRWIGHVRFEDRAAFFHLADVYLFPSKKEGWGLSVVDSVLCGRVPIVSNTSCLPEVVRDARDAFVLPLDVDRWVSRIRMLLADDTLRREMGKRGRERILRELSWEKVVLIHTQLFKRLIG